MLNVYKNQQNRQTGSRNLMGPKTLPTIWGTYMKLVTKYQISAINSCWEKCDEKCAYMFNVYKNQLSRQTGSRNPTSPKTLPTIWYTYMTRVTKYQISAINRYWEKYLGQTDRGKTVYPPPLSGSGRFKTSTHAQQSLGCLLETSEYLIAVHVSREKATNTFRISLVEENGSYCFKGLSWIFSDSTWPSTWFEFCSNNMAAFCVDEISDIFWLKQTLHK